MPDPLRYDPYVELGPQLPGDPRYFTYTDEDVELEEDVQMESSSESNPDIDWTRSNPEHDPAFQVLLDSYITDSKDTGKGSENWAPWDNRMV